MSKPKTPAKTIHHFAVAASLEAQSDAVMLLIQTVKTAIDIDGVKMSPLIREKLEQAADAAQAALWPQD